MPTAILEGRLGAPAGTVVNGEPMPDFGGHHPDPNPVHAARAHGADARPRRAGFRRGLGRRRRPQHDRRRRALFVTPSDSLAILDRPRASRARAMRAGLPGVARSMPTSRAVDRVAERLGIALLRDADGLEVLRQPARCRAHHPVRRGERRHGLEPHPREGRALGRAALAQHPGGAGRAGGRDRARTWAAFGRDYYSRHDYEEVDAAAADDADGGLRATARRACRARASAAHRRSPATTSPTATRSTAR